MKLFKNRLYFCPRAGAWGTNIVFLYLIYWITFALVGCQRIDFCNAGDPFSDCYERQTLLSTILTDTSSRPLPPTNVSVVSGSFSNRISWTSVPRAIEYQLYWSNSPIQNLTSAIKFSNVTSPFTHSDLLNGRVYYYKVTARTQFLESEPSLEVTGLPFSNNRRIYVTGTDYSISTVGSVAGADTICMNDSAKPTPSTVYKALLGDQTGCSGSPCRRASNTPNVGDGQIDWVLKPNTNYYRADGTTLIMTTNSNSIFIFGNFTNSITSVSLTPMTGMSGSWTTFSNSNCVNYSFTASGSVTTSLSNSTATASISGAGMSCGGNYPLYCVEQ
jgi:hypothetical protein